MLQSVGLRLQFILTALQQLILIRSILAQKVIVNPLNAAFPSLEIGPTVCHTGNSSEKPDEEASASRYVCLQVLSRQIPGM